MARNPKQFQKGISLNADPLALRANRRPMLRRPVPMAMAQWVSPRTVAIDRGCQLQPAPAVQSLHRQTSITAGTIFEAGPPSSRSRCGSRAHLLHDPGQERRLGDEGSTAIWASPTTRVAHAPQADAGDDGARPVRTRSAGADPARRCLSRRRAKRPANAVVVALRQDALCRRRRDQQAGTPAAHEAHRRGGLPSHRNRRLGAATPRHRHSVVSDGWPAFMASPRPAAFMSRLVVGSGKAAVERPSFDG